MVKRTFKSFSYAFFGIKDALRRGPNLKIHIAIGLLTLILAALFSFSPIEWILLIFTIFFVLTLEFVNSALEVTVNLASPEVKEEARIAKDISAASVLLAAIMAVAIGLILFLPKILSLFT